MRSIAQFQQTIFAALVFAWGGWSLAAGAAIVGQDGSQASGAQADSDRTGYLVRVSLPINSKVSDEVRRTLKQLAEQANTAVRREDRPIVVLEFDTASGKTGRGSELDSCMSLALYLGDPELNRLQTVAYIPASREVNEKDDPNLKGQLNGHAVLVAIAANQIAIDPGTAIGSAGIDETKLKPLYRDVYRNVAEQRLTTLPVAVVMSMLDKELQLYRVTQRNDGSVSYVDGAELNKLEASGVLSSDTETISSQGIFTNLTGAKLKKFGLVDLTPTSRTELARLLDLAPNSLEGNPVQGGNWKAVQLDLPPIIDGRTAKWVTNSLKQQVSRNDVNLIILNIEDNTGDVDACLRISQHLAEYSDEVWTVAFVRGKAQGPVGLIALSTTHLIMAPDATLGGQDEFATGEESQLFDDDELDSLRTLIKTLAQEKQTDWSMMMQMIDPSLVVTRYRHKESGQLRLLSNEEFEAIDEPEIWAALGPIGGVVGVDAETGWKNLLVRKIAEDMGEIQTFYQLDEEPESMRPSVTDRWVERLAGFLSSPFVSPLLLFAAMFFFSTEMSAPGLGLPGFLAALCFILFFWSQSLDGNADWLEIIMFLVGVVFIILEIFVLPGFGVFGIGGILLVITSLVLASQSFLIPRSSEDFVQMSYSMLPVIGAGFGVITGAIVLRHAIPHSPFLRRLILEPRERVDTGLEGWSDPEAVVDWSHLDGQPGETITRLFPSGKARIGGKTYDVITRGQMVDKGQSIIVIEAIGNRIVVKPADQVE